MTIGGERPGDGEGVNGIGMTAWPESDPDGLARAALRWLVRDRLIQALAVLVGLCLLLYTVGITGAGRGDGTAFLGPMALFLTVVLLRFRLEQLDTPMERRFWSLLSIGLLVWLVGTMGEIVAGVTGFGGSGLHVARALVFATAYLCAIRAVETAPDRGASPSDAGGQVGWEAVGLGVIGLVSYFMVIPTMMDAGVEPDAVAVLSVGLDLYIVVRLGVLQVQTGSARWRMLYRALAFAGVLWTASDLSAVWMGMEMPTSDRSGGVADGLRLASAVVLLGTIRLRAAPFPTGSRTVASILPPPHRWRGGLLLALAVGFPAGHLGLYVLGIPDPGLQRPRELLVFGLAVVLGGLAWWEGRRVARENERLAADRREAENRRQLAQRLETVGTLAAGLAHDFRNIITAIDGYADQALSVPADPATGRALQAIRQATKQAGELIGSLMTFGRRGSAERVPVDVKDVVEGSMRFLRRVLPAQVAIDVELHDQPAWTLGDMTELRRVLVNLVLNARDAVRTGGSIRLQVAVDHKVNTGAWIDIVVMDSGVGMSDAVRSRIFDPFYSGWSDGRGLGLGLAVVRGIVTEHGGSVDVRSAPGQGTAVTVRLPGHAPPPVGTEPAGASAVPPISRGATVLVAEDHLQVRAIITAALERAGFVVIAAGDGADALERFARAGQVDLAVLDFDMPGLDGLTCRARLHDLAPDLPVIVMTGFDELDEGTDEDLMVLRKPFTMNTLVAMARRVLAGTVGGP